MTAAPIDLDAYFRRIGYNGSRETSLTTLHEIVAAHAQNIPFENLDVLLGRPIALDPDSLLRKLVHERRGGYCFEQNGLLLLVLEALGFAARPMSARVRLQAERSVTPPRTHLFVRVELDGNSWLVDVGVGGLSLTCAIRVAFDVEQATPHETRRIIRVGDVYFHQARLGSEWADVYEFTLEEMPLIDREVGNWYTSTHPNSRFRKHILVARAAPAGVRITVQDDEFSIRAADGHAEKRIIASVEELCQILEEHFGLIPPPGLQLPVPA